MQTPTRKYNILLTALTALALTPAAARAQSVISSELMRQLRNDRGASEQINRYLRNPSVRDSLLTRAAAAADSAAADSLAFLADDSLSVLADTAGRQRSVYEDMFMGKDIYPDSLIPHLRPYGYEVFSRPRSHSVGLGEMGGVPADYPVRAGDEVRVHLWGRINEEYALKVSREGNLNIPHNVGPVAVAGLSFGAMQRAVTDKLKNIEGVNVNLSMGELRPIGVYIVGEVAAPGFHTVSPMTSVTNALFAAGGITRRGSLRGVRLMRGGRLVAEVDFYEFLNSGSDRTGLRLQPGDVITVPVARQMVAVVGNVRRSALYEIKKPVKLLGSARPRRRRQPRGVDGARAGGAV